MALSKKKRILIESLVVGGLVIGFVSVFLVQRFSARQENLIGNVYHNRLVVKSFELSALSEEGELYTLKINQEDYLTIHAKHNAIAVKESSCPGQNCVHQGYIHSSNDIIVCAHFNVYIALEGTASNTVVVG